MTSIYKQIRNFTVSFLILITLSAGAQVSITSDDMPSPGDTIRKSNAITSAGIDYTITGENHNWDFTPLLPLFQTVDTFASVSSVPFLYQIIFIPNLVANLAQKFPEADTLGVPITDPYRFFKNTSSEFTDVGFAVTVNDFPIPLKFDDPDVIYDFPVEYGNVDSSFSGVGFGIPDIGFISIDRKRVNEVDGWGTLTTSYGTFDVLRMKSVVEETDSVYIDSIGFGQAIDRFYTEYKWLSPGHVEPLLQVTEEGPLLTVAWMDSVTDPFTAIPEPLRHQNRLSVFPNPLSASGKIKFSVKTSGRVNISIFDLTGTEVMKLYDGMLPHGDHELAIERRQSKLNGGIYFIRMQNADGVLTHKLVIR